MTILLCMTCPSMNNLVRSSSGPLYPWHVQLRHSKLPHTNSLNLFIETHSIIEKTCWSSRSPWPPPLATWMGHQHACTQESSETFRSWGFFSNRLLIIPFTNLRFIFLILFSSCDSLQMKSNLMKLSSWGNAGLSKLFPSRNLIQLWKIMISALSL